MTSRARELLGRHVGRRARARRRRPASLLGQAGQAEVGDARACPRPSIITLAGLRSRCSTPLSCAAARPAQSCARDLERLVLGQAADAAQQRGQVLAVHVLHGEEGVALRLADVVDAAHVGMRDLARDAHLAVEALQPLGSSAQRLGQELQGHRLAELQVVRAVDLAHARRARAGPRCGSGPRAPCPAGSGRRRGPPTWAGPVADVLAELIVPGAAHLGPRGERGRPPHGGPADRAVPRLGRRGRVAQGTDDHGHRHVTLPGVHRQTPAGRELAGPKRAGTIEGPRPPASYP